MTSASASSPALTTLTDSLLRTAIAQDGQILISEAAYRHVEDFVEVIEQLPLPVKRRSTPEIVYVVVGLKQ